MIKNKIKDVGDIFCDKGSYFIVEKIFPKLIDGRRPAYAFLAKRLVDKRGRIIKKGKPMGFCEFSYTKITNQDIMEKVEAERVVNVFLLKHFSKAKEKTSNDLNHDAGNYDHDGELDSGLMEDLIKLFG